MKGERDVDALWAALMEDEPEVDETRLITSSQINQQSAARLAGMTDEPELMDRMKLRFSGQSTNDHRLAVRTASKGLLAVQESLSSVGASIVDHFGRAGRWPAEVLAATELKFTPRVLPGSIEFALVHTAPSEETEALFTLEKEKSSLFDQSLTALLALFTSLADDDLSPKAVNDQLVSFGPRTSKHLFDLAQVLLSEHLSLDVEWQSPEGKISCAGVSQRSAAYLKELATKSASTTHERILHGQLITVSEIDRQGLLLDDSTRILLEADPGLQDELAALYRRRVQATVAETLKVNLSTGAETRNYVLTALAALGSDYPDVVEGSIKLESGPPTGRAHGVTLRDLPASDRAANLGDDVVDVAWDDWNQ
ncbi:hypothetical protein [Arthrobacter sp. S39]|uniref:hypothetical protein n=1 Tax=Arthrobacter sp. S39 TaxID=2509720 RepID=UPI001037C47A|nr:hypothetical protein [Arthrobacter sp. S39]TAP45634.1 hypothetical protein EYS21_02645 [Arthrobacter sp. S39]